MKINFNQIESSGLMERIRWDNEELQNMLRELFKLRECEKIVELSISKFGIIAMIQ